MLNSHKSSLIQLAAMASGIGAQLMSAATTAASTSPAGIWIGLQHRGQAPARGIFGKFNDPAWLGKGPSRRDRHRGAVQRVRSAVATYPDFSAQRAQEAKAARGRKARHTVR